MVDVRNKRCEHDGCITRASYNYEGEKELRYCVTHKLPGMMDIMTKRCEHEGCITIASYGYRNQKVKY